ncbi:MAG: Asp-tRNA(Asn)/Glu-tRNA(Gln) amidotransferase subunit GatA [Lachnospiraceae bacterium]|nr:Asp-tRNA(Asn)/Glu-tRNA(Gln) amidotransferase subunit GatA [Lachnospiraceae bacterium]
MELMDLTAKKAVEMIKNKEISATELVKAHISQIEKKEDILNSFISLDMENALTEAKKTDEMIGRGEDAGALAGIPIAVKDNICTEGLRTTCGSKMLESFVPSYDAEVVRRIRKAGAIIIGKTNMDEFAMGNSTETSAYGVCRNPRNTDLVPGGSSGGSCAAVASCESMLALGSDTGGSVRQPAAFCGVVGIKPTYGTVSRYGLVSYGSSLEQVGPVAKTVEDCALTLDVISGYDRKDSTSVKREYGFSDMTGQSIKGMKIAVPISSGAVVDNDICKNMEETVYKLKNAGAIVEEIEMTLDDYVVPAYYTIASAEASSNLSRFDGVKYGYRNNNYEDLHKMYKNTRTVGFGTEVKRRIMLGTFALSSGYYEDYYLRAMKVRALIAEEYKNVFDNYDVIMTPVSPVKPWNIGEGAKLPVETYKKDIFTIAANLTGMPAISVPTGLYEEGIPSAVQFMADCFKETNIIKVAHIIETV